MPVRPSGPCPRVEALAISPMLGELMGKTPTERYGTRLSAWLGMFIATTVGGPAWFRLAERGFSWPDALLLAAGAGLLIFWAVRLVLLERLLRTAGKNAGSP